MVIFLSKRNLNSKLISLIAQEELNPEKGGVGGYLFIYLFKWAGLVVGLSSKASCFSAGGK